MGIISITKSIFKQVKNTLGRPAGGVVVAVPACCAVQIPVLMMEKHVGCTCTCPQNLQGERDGREEIAALPPPVGEIKEYRRSHSEECTCTLVPVLGHNHHQ